MKRIILLWPNKEPLESLKKEFTELFSEYAVLDNSKDFSNVKAAILFINAEDGPIEVAVDQLIEMRKNRIQNVFGFIYNSNKVSDSEILKLINQRTKELLNEYGYLGPEFAVYSDSKDSDQFISFVRKNIDNTSQMNFTLPKFTCRFCGYTDNKNFAICSSCRKKQKKSFFASLFGKNK
ncbi:MAG: hypothetical protein KAQ64_02345 [Candidatus Pacebacteria bacterium]|nr:hypothetical protein [Candidatus Paceibacterota bacterium]